MNSLRFLHELTPNANYVHNVEASDSEKYQFAQQYQSCHTSRDYTSWVLKPTRIMSLEACHGILLGLNKLPILILKINTKEVFMIPHVTDVEMLL